VVRLLVYRLEELLYNILDLKYLQGKKVREVAQKLAISESDLYRKQRTAIAEVARTLAEMESEAAEEEPESPASPEPVP
jgi:DNA-directed RNA polymerase specialized sigma subunit